jgi:hypothetical protein
MRAFLFAARTNSCMLTYRRLPHSYPADRWLFITWHLYGSLPASQYPMPHNASAGQALVWIDRQLDRASSGPVFLRQQAIAQLVRDPIERGVRPN